MGISFRPTGLDHAAAALRNLERRQDVIANNLANVSTVGFKGERVFTMMLDGSQAPVIQSDTDRRVGALTTTGAPLDLAITGQGFLVVGTPNGERLTRGGSLQINDARQLVDANGNVLLGEDDARGGAGGAVTIPESTRELIVDRTGAVIADGTQIARLRFETVAADAPLEHEGASLFRAPESRTRVPLSERTLQQGATEESNVSSLDSLVDLISVQRAYASVQKVMTTIDAARGTTANEIGKPV